MQIVLDVSIMYLEIFQKCPTDFVHNFRVSNSLIGEFNLAKKCNRRFLRLQTCEDPSAGFFQIKLLRVHFVIL